MAEFDLNRLSNGDRLIAVGGIVLLIFSFFDWFGFGGEALEAAEAAGVDTAENGWGFTLPLLAILIGISMLVIVAVKAFGVQASSVGNFSWGQVLLVMGAVAFAFVLIKLIVGVDVDTGGVDVDIDIDRKIGIFGGLVGSAGLAAGGFLRFQEEKGSRPATPPPA